MTNLTDFSLYIAYRRTSQKQSKGIKSAILDLNTKFGEEEEYLARLDSEITNIESNPSEEERKQAFEEIRLDILEYESTFNKLKNMHTGTINHLLDL